MRPFHPDDRQVSNGGGICNDYGTLIVTNSTVLGNTAFSHQKSSYSGQGGSIYNSGIFTITNSTISGNTSSSNDSGGIFNSISNPNYIITATLIFCTIVNNSASGHNGFNIVNASEYGQPPSKVYMKANIVGGTDAQHNPIAGRITSGGYNVIQHMSSENFDASPTHTTDHSVDDLTGVFGAHPQLQNNSGTTQTYQLIGAAGNPAFDIISPDTCTDFNGKRVLTDQRGMRRPGKSKQLCDSGAYESQR